MVSFLRRDDYEKTSGKNIQDSTVVVIEKDFKTDFLRTFKNPLRLTELETALTDDLKGISVLCCLLPDPEKVVPSDVPLYEAGKKVTTLRTENKKHFSALEEMADDHFAIRLRVPPSEVDLVGKQADKLETSFMEHSKKIISRTKGVTNLESVA